MDASSYAEEEDTGNTLNVAPRAAASTVDLAIGPEDSLLQKAETKQSTLNRVDPEIEEFGKLLLEKHKNVIRAGYESSNTKTRHESDGGWNAGELSPIMGPPDEMDNAILQTASTSSTDAVLQVELNVPVLTASSPTKNSKRTPLDVSSPRMNPLAPSPRHNNFGMNQAASSSEKDPVNKAKSFNLPNVRSSMTSEWQDALSSPNANNSTIHRSNVSSLFSEDNDENDEFFDCE